MSSLGCCWRSQNVASVPKFSWQFPALNKVLEGMDSCSNKFNPLTQCQKKPLASPTKSFLRAIATRSSATNMARFIAIAIFQRYSQPTASPLNALGDSPISLSRNSIFESLLKVNKAYRQINDQFLDRLDQQSMALIQARTDAIDR